MCLFICSLCLSLFIFLVILLLQQIIGIFLSLLAARKRSKQGEYPTELLSFKIRPRMFPVYIKLADLLILRL